MIGRPTGKFINFWWWCGPGYGFRITFHFPHRCLMGDFRIIISISHTDSRPTFTTPGEMTDPDKIMNTEHFWSYLTDIRIRIQINPKIWIIIIIITITTTTTTITTTSSRRDEWQDIVCRVSFFVYCYAASVCLSVRPSRSWILSKRINISSIFIARQHTDARYWYSKYVCLSVRPSVCPSVCPLRSGIRWKRLNISSQFFYHTVAQSL